MYKQGLQFGSNFVWILNLLSYTTGRTLDGKKIYEYTNQRRRKWHKDEQNAKWGRQNVYALPGNIRLIKAGRRRRSGRHYARSREIRNLYKKKSQNLQGTDILEHLGVDSIILQWILTFESLLVTWCINNYNIQNCTLSPHCIYLFCIYLRTNSDLCHLHHNLIGFYNRDEKCLLRGTNWVFK
jgi:hypothetical protein